MFVLLDTFTAKWALVYAVSVYTQTYTHHILPHTHTHICAGPRQVWKKRMRLRTNPEAKHLHHPCTRAAALPMAPTASMADAHRLRSRQCASRVHICVCVQVQRAMREWWRTLHGGTDTSVSPSIYPSSWMTWMDRGTCAGVYVCVCISAFTPL